MLSAVVGFRPLILSFEVVIALLAVYKGAEQWKNGSLRRSRLMQVIMRDSLTYFFMYASPRPCPPFGH